MANTPKYTMNAVDSHRWIKPTMPDGLNLSVGENSNCKDETCATGYCFHGDCPSVVRPFYVLAEDGGAYLTTHDGVIYYLAPGSTRMKMVYPENGLVSRNEKAAPYDSTGASLSVGGSAVRFEFNITEADFQLVVRPSLNKIIPWRPGSTTCMVRVGTDYTGADSVVYSGRSEYARMSTPKGNGGNIQGGLTQPFSNGYYCVQTDYNRCVVFYKDSIIYQGRYSGMGTPTPFYYAKSCCTAGSCCPRRDTSKIEWEYNIFPKWKLSTDGGYKVSTTLDKYVARLTPDANGLVPNVIERVEEDGVFKGYSSVGGYCFYDLVTPVVITTVTYNYVIYDISDNKVIGYAVVSEDGDTKGEITSITTRLKNGDNEVDFGALKRTLESRFVGRRVAWSMARCEIACSLKDDERVGTPDYDCEYEGVFRFEYNEETETCQENQRGGAPGRIFWYQGRGYNENGSNADLWVSRWREELCVSCDTSSGGVAADGSNQPACQCAKDIPNIYTSDNNCKYQNPDTAHICGKCNYPVTLEDEEPVWKHRQDCSSRNNNRSSDDHIEYRDTWVCKAALAKVRLAHLGGRIESIYYGDGSESDWAYISVGDASCRTNKDYTIIGAVDGRKGEDRKNDSDETENPDEGKVFLPGYVFDKTEKTWSFYPSAADAVVLRAPSSYAGDSIKTCSVGFPKGEAFTIRRIVERSKGDEETVDPPQLHSFISEKLDGFYTDCSGSEQTQTQVQWEEKRQTAIILTDETWVDADGNEKKHTNTKTVETTETGKYNTVFSKTYKREKSIITENGTENVIGTDVEFTPSWTRGDDDYVNCSTNTDSVSLSDAGKDFDPSDNTFIESIILTHDYDSLPKSTVSFETKEWEDDGETDSGSGSVVKRAKVTGITTVEVVETNTKKQDSTNVTTTQTTTIKVTKTLSVPQVWTKYTPPTNVPDINDPYKEYDRDADSKAFKASAYVQDFDEGDVVITEDATVTRLTTTVTETSDHPGSTAVTEEEETVVDPVEVRRHFMRFFPAYTTRPGYVPPLNDGTKDFDTEWETTVETKGCSTTKDYPGWTERACSKSVVTEKLNIVDGFYRVGELDKNPPDEEDDQWEFKGFVNQPEGSSHWFAKWRYKETTHDDEDVEQDVTEQDGGNEQSEEVLIELPRPNGICDDHTYSLLDDITSPEGGKWYCLGPSESEDRGFSNYGGGEEGDTEGYESFAGIKWVQAVFVWGDPEGVAIRGGTQVGDVYYKLGEVEDKTTSSSTQDSEEPYEVEQSIEFEELAEDSDRYWYWNGYEWIDGGAYFSDIDSERVIFYKDKGNLDIGVADFEEQDENDSSSSEETTRNKTIEGREEKEVCEHSKAIFAGKVRSTQACGDILAVNLNAGEDYHSAVFYKEKPIWDRPAFSSPHYPDQIELLRCLGSSYTVLVYNTGENKQRLCIWYHPYGVETLEPKTTFAQEFDYNEIPDIAIVKDKPVNTATIARYGAEKVVKSYMVTMSRDRMRLYVFYKGELIHTYRYNSEGLEGNDFVTEEDVNIVCKPLGGTDSAIDNWLINNGYVDAYDRPDRNRYFFRNRQNIEQRFAQTKWLQQLCGPRFCVIRRGDSDNTSGNPLSYELRSALTATESTAHRYDIWVDGQLQQSNIEGWVRLGGSFIECPIGDVSRRPEWKRICPYIEATLLISVDSGQSFLLSKGSAASGPQIYDKAILERTGYPSWFVGGFSGTHWDATVLPLVKTSTSETHKDIEEDVFLICDTDGAYDTFSTIPYHESYSSSKNGSYQKGDIVVGGLDPWYLYECVMTAEEIALEQENGESLDLSPLAYPERLTADQQKNQSRGKMWRVYDISPCDIELKFYCLRWNPSTQTALIDSVDITPKSLFTYYEGSGDAWLNKHSNTVWTDTRVSADPLVRKIKHACLLSNSTVYSIDVKENSQKRPDRSVSVVKVQVIVLCTASVSDGVGGGPVALFVYNCKTKSPNFIDLSYILSPTNDYTRYMYYKLLYEGGYSGGEVPMIPKSSGAKTFVLAAATDDCAFTKPDLSSLITPVEANREYIAIGSGGDKHIDSLAKDNGEYMLSVSEHTATFVCCRRTFSVSKDDLSVSYYERTGSWYDIWYGHITGHNAVTDIIMNYHFDEFPNCYRFHDSYSDYSIVDIIDFTGASAVAHRCDGAGTCEFPYRMIDGIFYISPGSNAPIYEISVNGITETNTDNLSFMPYDSNPSQHDWELISTRKLCDMPEWKTWDELKSEHGGGEDYTYTYYVGDRRRYNNVPYECIVEHTTTTHLKPTPTSSTHYWKALDSSDFEEVTVSLKPFPHPGLCNEAHERCSLYFITKTDAEPEETTTETTTEGNPSTTVSTTTTTYTSHYDIYYSSAKLPVYVEFVWRKVEVNTSTETLPGLWTFHYPEGDVSYPESALPKEHPLILNCCRRAKDKTLNNYTILVDGSIWYKNELVTKLSGSLDDFSSVTLSCCGNGVLIKYKGEVLLLIDGEPVTPFVSGEDEPEPRWLPDLPGIGYQLSCCGYDYYLLKAVPVSVLDPDYIYGRDCSASSASCPDWVEDITDPYEKRFTTKIREDATRTLDDGSIARVIEKSTIDTSYEIKSEGEPTVTVYRSYEYPVKWKAEKTVGDDAVEFEFLDDTEYSPVDNAEYKQDLDPESVVEKKTVRYVPWRRPVMMKDCNTYVYYKTTLISTDPRITDISCFRYKNIYANDKARMPEYHATAAYAIFYDNPADTTPRMSDEFRITKPSESGGSEGDVASSSVYYYKARWEGTAVQNILGVKKVDKGYDADERVLYDSASVQVDDTSTCCDHEVTGTTEAEKNTFCATKGKIKESQKNTCIIVWSRAVCQTRTRDKNGSTVINFHNNDKPFIPYWDGEPYKSDSPDYSTYGRLDELIVDEVYAIEGDDQRSAIEKLRDDVLYINDYNAAGRWDRVSGDDPVDAWLSDDNSFQSNPYCAGVGGLFTSAPAYHTQQDPDNEQLDEFGRLIISGNNTLYVFDDILGRHDYNIQTGEKLSYKKKDN